MNSTTEQLCAEIIELKTKALLFARQIDGDTRDLPEFGPSKYGESEVIFEKGIYKYIIQERGKVYHSHESADPNEILFWIFNHFTRSQGSSKAAKIYDSTKPFREVLWDEHLRMLQILNPEWKIRSEKIIADFLDAEKKAKT